MGLFDKMKQAASAAGGNQTVTFTFQELPESLAQMQALPEASLDTPFKTAALTVCALCAYGADKNIGKEMLNWLRGPRPLNGQDISFLNDRFRDGKSYIPFSYFVGASPENGYTPRQPFTLLVGSNHTSNVEEGYCKLFIPCGGADDPRPIKLRRKGNGQCCCATSAISPPTPRWSCTPAPAKSWYSPPFLSGENGHVVEAEGVCDFTIYPEGDDWETTTSPWSLEGNWLEIARDTDEGYSETAPEDADRMCFLPVDGETEGNQLPFTASYITPYPELNVEEADLFYQEGTPEVPFRSNQEWYATFTGEDGSRYAITLEDEDTLALKVYLDGNESYLSLVNTVYFARQEAMG